MNKRDYFVKALEAQCYLHKEWILEAFSIVEMPKDRVVEYAYPLIRDEKGRYAFIDEKGAAELIEGAAEDAPLFSFHENLVLHSGELPNLNKNVETTYGSALFNAIALVYPFGSKIPYIEGSVSAKPIEALVMSKMTDTPTKPDDITVSEYLRFGEAMYSLVGLTQLCVPSATAKTMTSDPRMAELRAKLLEENKDHLNDPVVIAKIEAALVAMDREWMKGDPGEGFYIKDKSYTNVRKQLFGIYGAEDPFGDGTSVTLIEKSLNDGWDINKLPEMASSLREGSYNRGHQTELGGAIAKEINRYCTNSSISEKDCGSKIGLPTLITNKNKKNYLGNYIFVEGKEILTTHENIDEFVGKEVDVRSPVYCRTPGIDYCEHCCGVSISQTPKAIGSYVADIGQNFMLVFMKSMHQNLLSIASWDKDLRIL